jgi:DNA (cytosine-5)-methyltransferase 1
VGTLTHASFFSGVGGLDLGLERAGWRTVSFSEIDPYASAVLAERWPGVPNLGDVTALSGSRPDVPKRQDDPVVGRGTLGRPDGVRPDTSGRGEHDGVRVPWQSATLWTGGFPCQDLSVAGKRRGMVAGTRSNLAHAFLDLVERHRPPAIVLENVPGLLSSHGGKDLGALLGRLGELGYGWAYRVLDARHFGVPQRRRRVFIVAFGAGTGLGADGAAEVLSVGSRCRRHPPTGVEAGPDAADGARPGVDVARAVVATAGKRHDEDIDTLVPGVWQGHGSNVGPFGAVRAGNGNSGGGVPFLVSPSPDAGRVRAADGLARRLDDRDGVANALSASAGHGSPRGDGGDNLVAYAVRPQSGRPQAWNETLPIGRGGMSDDPLLPGLDSHRYRCCGNGVVAPVAEWLGARLAEALA